MEFRYLFIVLFILTDKTVLGIGVPPIFSALISGNKDDPIAENSIDNSGPALVAENDFTALRIEYIKNQILKKLRLKEKPKVYLRDLPKPVKEYENILSNDDIHLEGSYSDDFYGKTTQAIIFPYKDDLRCARGVRFPAACLPFQMPNDIHSSEVSKVDLWFHKKKDSLDSHNQTFVLSEIAHWDSNKSFQKIKPIAIQEVTLTEGWIKVDVSYIVKSWLDLQKSPIHAINVVCKTCGMDATQAPISSKSDLKPFLVIYTHSQTKKSVTHRRRKRSANCSQGVNECCRESLYISFADIGWDDWIIKPEGYNAYFCRGSCMTASAMTLSATQHHSILRKVMYDHNKNWGSRPELTPCCAATQFQPLQLVYMHGNKTLTTKLLSNMIVETCGCM